MDNYLKTDYIEEERIEIGNIPALLLRPRSLEGKMPTIIFYHGWSSNKESQRIRGMTLALFGYQVLIPDAIYHGEREPIAYSRANQRYFWKTIFQNIEEADLLIDGLVEKYQADREKIVVMGHSMGAFTGGGIFTHNNRIRACLPINGSLAWVHANKLLVEGIDLEDSDEIREIEKKIREIDPIGHLDKIGDRPMLILNGGGDLVVSPKSQRLYYKEAKEYSDKISHIEYPYVGHFITTNMMEDAIRWLKNIL